MEGILKLRMPIFAEGLPREIVFRSIAVILCVFILGIFAQRSGVRHMGAAGERENAAGHMETGAFDRNMAGGLDKKSADSVRRVLPPIPISEPSPAKTPVMSEKFLPESGLFSESIAVRCEMPDDLPDIYMEASDVIEEEDKGSLGAPVIGEPEAVSVLRVYAYGNGGMPELLEFSGEAGAFTADHIPCPKRAGKLFGGWYMDAGCTVPFSGVAEGAELLELYAGWKEYPGFTADERGYITGCTGTEGSIIEGLLRIPDYEGCTGIESGAFDGLADSIAEVFIPANIRYIAPDAFDGLANLMYFEVMEGNPAYYSEYGILYYSDGTEAVYPEGRKSIYKKYSEE